MEFIFWLADRLIVASGRWMVNVLSVVKTSILVIAILVKVKAVWVLEATIFVDQEAFSIIIGFIIFFNRIWLIILMRLARIVCISFLIEWIFFYSYWLIIQFFAAPHTWRRSCCVLVARHLVMNPVSGRSELGFLLSLYLLRGSILGSCRRMVVIFSWFNRLGSVYAFSRVSLVLINDSSDTCIFITTIFYHFMLSGWLLVSFKLQWLWFCLLLTFLNVLHRLFGGGYQFDQ